MEHIPLSFFLHTLGESTSALGNNGSHDAAAMHDMSSSLLDQLLDVLLKAMSGWKKWIDERRT